MALSVNKNCLMRYVTPFVINHEDEVLENEVLEDDEIEDEVLEKD